LIASVLEGRTFALLFGGILSDTQTVVINGRDHLKGLVGKSFFAAIIIAVVSIALHFAFRSSLFTLFVLLFIAERIYESYYTTRRVEDLEKDRHLSNIVKAFTVMVLGAILEFYILRRPIIPALTLSGFGLLALSGILRWSAIKVVGDDWAIETFAVPETIKRNGPYQFFRHPYYLGVFLEAISFPLILNSWYTLIFSVCVVAPLEGYRALLEEEMLVDRFGWFYIRFKREINRFLPTLIRRRVYDRRLQLTPNNKSVTRRKSERRRSEQHISGKDRRRIIVGKKWEVND
jgi:methyltransferase